MLGVGDRYREFELVAIVLQAAPMAVPERDFSHWGILAYIGAKGPVATMRKAVGKLDNLPSARAFRPQYFDRILKAQEVTHDRPCPPNSHIPGSARCKRP